jgi:glyceraldehyde 3-phosphate dehydrogenase
MSKTPLYQKKFHFKSTEDGVELIKVVSDLWYDKSIEMVLFKINYWIKRKRNYQFTSVCRRFCGQTDYHFDSVEIAKVVLSLDLHHLKVRYW